MSPLPRSSFFLGLALAAAHCGTPPKLPDLPAPEYEPARQLDLTPRPAAPPAADPAKPPAPPAPAAPPASAPPAAAPAPKAP